MPPLPLTPSPAVPYSTALTSMSGRPKEEWGKLLGDVPAAGAIPDRFLHHAEIINITGKSYRLQNRQSRTTTEDNPGKTESKSSQEACKGTKK